MAKQQSSLEAKYVLIEKLSLQQVLGMYAVFIKYYNCVEQDVFIQDMIAKDGVIILMEKTTKRIVGFSTLKTFEMNLGGRKSIGVFSGDTILERQYWGDRSLHKRFSTYLFGLKLSNPVTPIYWLLISKGYKTYLLLANNFLSYYPRVDTPVDKKSKSQCKNLELVVRNYCETLFEKSFNKEKMLLEFGEDSQRLKENVAEITDEMRSKHAKIDFFVEKNPEWHKGVELPCAGEVSFKLFAAYFLKLCKGKSVKKADVNTQVPAGKEVAAT
ncbi:hypothetical protein FKG94_27135 [Exilibacterium tricleocarpae]|uniref:Uncharacterized protein n=1 Tax=Exilibacterium tricleocarpae TaxID=2591008 RepID=A0A545SNG7_9GAMM|nr:hypothetical protein [Exilibacterium tricleocarpae]TQV66509.1 hypothetical protein FKG94_27135 [Exilibacterium tricleocarpae]